MILQQGQELGGNHVRDRHLFCRLIGGVAVHNALVTGAALVHTECDVRRLLVHQDADTKHLAHVPSQLFGTDAGKHIVDDLLVVGLIVGGDLASNKKLALFQQTFDRHTGVLVMLEDVGHNGICDLVTDLVGMAVADLFTGDKKAYRRLSFGLYASCTVWSSAPSSTSLNLHPRIRVVRPPPSLGRFLATVKCTPIAFLKFFWFSEE